jgi:hypothetical protein
MQLNDLKIRYAFKTEDGYESSYPDFNDFIGDNGQHSRREFENDTCFTISDKNDNFLIIIRDENRTSGFWHPIGKENKPFRFLGEEQEYILEFECEGEASSTIGEMVAKYWRDDKEVSCKIKQFGDKIISSDPFWRPKRIETKDFYNGY